ncbi:hypothetical protein KJ644_01150 [Candidatus Dependentiae bacterium]|nr:hypothetical protein [Candidatus Dependentiae bacterium]MBU4387057.1 hypothetical protein [Candidatus Dependentiae bacterium]MCG2755963.1 hypothetical protein [Candidatus Dependentiae bacterium]
MKRRFLKLFVFYMSFVLTNNVLGVSTENINQATNDKLALDSLIALKTQFIKNLEKIFMCKNYWELRYYSPTVDNKVADFVFNSSDKVKQKVEKLDAIKIRYSIYLGKIDELISVITKNNSSEDLISEVDFCINSFFSKNIYPGTLEYQREFNLFKDYDIEQKAKVIEDNNININALKIYSKSLLKEFNVPNYFKRNLLKASIGGTGLALGAWLIYNNRDSIQNSINSMYSNFKDLKTAEYYRDILQTNIQNTADEIFKKFEKDEIIQEDGIEEKNEKQNKWELDDLLNLKKKMLNCKYKDAEVNAKNELNFIENDKVKELIDSIKNYINTLNDKEKETKLNTGTSFVGGLVAKMINGVTGNRFDMMLDGVDSALAEFFKTLTIADDGLNKVDDLKNKIPDIIELHYLIAYRIIADQLGNVVHVSNIAKNTILGISSALAALWVIKKILTWHKNKIKDINFVKIELYKVLLKYKHQKSDIYFDSINYADKGLFIYYMEKLQNLSNGILGQDKINLIKLIDALNDKSKTIYEKVNLIKLEQNLMLVGA